MIAAYGLSLHFLGQHHYVWLVEIIHDRQACLTTIFLALITNIDIDTLRILHGNSSPVMEKMSDTSYAKNYLYEES